VSAYAIIESERARTSFLRQGQRMEMAERRGELGPHQDGRGEHLVDAVLLLDVLVDARGHVVPLLAVAAGQEASAG